MRYENTKNLWKKWWSKKPWYGRRTNLPKHLGRSEEIVRIFMDLGLTFSSFCELGIGSGRNIFYFHKCFPDAEYFGVDISPMVESVIRECHSSILEFVKLHIGDVLTFLQNPQFPTECIFTHGLLMHIPQDTIEELMQLIFEWSRIVVFCEAYHESYRKTKSYRFERDYKEYFPENFELLFNEPVDHKSHLYIGKKNE